MATISRTVAKADISNAVAQAGTKIIADTYHTGAYLWIKDKSRSAPAASNIARLQNPNIQAVYFKERIPGGSHYIRASGPDLFRAPGMEQANQYLLRSFHGPNGPDLVVFFRQGAASLPGGQASWKGDHGGADWESQHIPLVFSGPGVRQGYVSSFPARLMDIAPTLLALMGVPGAGMDGTRLADAIKGSPLAAQTAQRAKQVELQRLVTSLQAESRLDLQGR
jgi:hypothetical protein